MLEEARRDGNKEAHTSFFYANEAEKMHAALFERALMYVKEEMDAPAGDILVCMVCGYTVEGTAPEKCRVCSAPSSQFEKID